MPSACASPKRAPPGTSGTPRTPARPSSSASISPACRHLAAGETPALPPKTTSFQAWAERLAEHARSAALDNERDWWHAHLAGAAPEPLPLDRPADPGPVASGRVVGAELDPEATA